MTFGLKDLLYVVGWAGSVIVLFLSFKNKLETLEKSNGLLKKIIFLDSGELSIMTTTSCEKTKQVLRSEINGSKADLKEAIKDIKAMGDNILIIMTHLEIKRPKAMGGD